MNREIAKLTRALRSRCTAPWLKVQIRRFLDEFKAKESEWRAHVKERASAAYAGGPAESRAEIDEIVRQANQELDKLLADFAAEGFANFREAQRLAEGITTDFSRDLGRAISLGRVRTVGEIKRSIEASVRARTAEAEKNLRRERAARRSAFSR